VAAARARLSGAGTQPNPTLELSAYNGTISEDADGISQRLEIAGQPGLRSASARAELQAAEHDLAGERRRLALDVVSAWLALWEARQGVSTARDLLALEDKVLYVAQERLRLGLAALREVLPVRVDRDLARQELVDARLEEQERLGALNALLSRAPEAAVGDLPLPEVGRLDERPLASLVDEAIARRPEVQALRARARAQELQARLAGRQRSPDLVFSAYQTPLLTRGAQQGVRMSVEIPLFDYGSIASEVRARREEARAIVNDAREKELEVAREVQAAWRRAAAAEERVRILVDSVEPDAGRSAEMVRKAFDSGYATYLEIISAQRTLREARLQTARARAARVRSRAALAQTVGATPEELLRAVGEETRP
jgi:outer membrane protein TolC